MEIIKGYESLAKVLQDALNQAQSGKGLERHAAGEPFDQQEICVNTRAVGLGYPLGQARKKARESKRLFKDWGVEAGVAECLGAINYLAAAVIVMREELEKEPLEAPNCDHKEDYNTAWELRNRYLNEQLTELKRQQEGN